MIDTPEEVWALLAVITVIVLTGAVILQAFEIGSLQETVAEHSQLLFKIVDVMEEITTSTDASLRHIVGRIKNPEEG